MKLIIAGSRGITEELAIDVIEQMIIKHNITVSEIVSGTARGVDRAGEVYAKSNGISVKLFPADWDKYGRPAGMIRNKQMAEYADALLLVWDGNSKGSYNMKTTMEKFNKPVYTVIVKPGRV